MALTALEQRLTASIASRSGTLLDDLRLHVGLPTGHNNSEALIATREHFTARCKALGAVPELVPGDARPAWLDWDTPASPTANTPPPPTAVLRRLGSANPSVPAVLLAGHLDTVHDPRGSFHELSIAPGGKTATGPGCVDMKGGLVIAMHALEALQESGIDTAWTLTLNSDEETGSYCSDRALRAEAASGRYVAALALEPAMAGGELAVQRGGSGQFMLEAFGRAAHVGRDFASGVSATAALARATVAAMELSDPPAGLCVNVSPLECRSPPNVVADHARAWGNARFPVNQVGSDLQSRLGALARGGPDQLPRVIVHQSFNRPAKPLTPDTEALALRARRAAEDLGQRLPFGKTAGVCDGNNLQDAGLPTIDSLGVRGGGLHTPQEWIELASLVERCQLLALLIARLCVGTQP